MSREQIVRDTAYAIWEAEGKPEGRDAEHWRQAEARVAASLQAKPQSPRPDRRRKARCPPRRQALPAAARPPAKAAATKAAPTKV